MRNENGCVGVALATPEATHVRVGYQSRKLDCISRQRMYLGDTPDGTYWLFSRFTCVLRITGHGCHWVPQ
jgi:hypothetical protein